MQYMDWVIIDSLRFIWIYDFILEKLLAFVKHSYSHLRDCILWDIFKPNIIISRSQTETCFRLVRLVLPGPV